MSIDGNRKKSTLKQFRLKAKVFNQRVEIKKEISKKFKLPNDNKIIGRETEKEILEEVIESNKAEFLAIYGRRRVGKTYLITNFIRSVKCVFFHVTGIQKGSLEEQLEEFAIQIGSTFYQGASITVRGRWRDALKDLTEAMDNLPKNKKIVLFF